MMKHKPLSAVFVVLLLALCLALPGLAEEESFDASTMRLLNYTGDVQILDLEGVPRFVLENVRFASGETMVTGEDSLASVGLDDSKIVTLDALTKVSFIQEAEHMLLNLLEGQIFIDVSEKLDENASFDIQTTTMTVGIRGTLIFGRVLPAEKPGDPAVTAFGVLEGQGQIDTKDSSGTRRVFDVGPGDIITATEAGDGSGVSFEVSQMTSADTGGFVQDVVHNSEQLTKRVLDGSPNGEQLLAPPAEGVGTGAAGGPKNKYPASGTWAWNDPVQIIAQSASKLYDGEPLRRTGSALVSGLPESCTIDVICSGERTDAGTGVNRVDSFAIYNSAGEDITGHFTNIETVDGTLRVDPAPLTIWTGSAEKAYDGEPLTCRDAGIRTVPGYMSEEPEWRNTSVVSRTGLGAETMVGVSGSVWVHGSNPLTGEEKEIELKTGQRLVVSLGDEDGQESISFTVETLEVSQLPEDVLRLYADNPELMAQACADVPEWDPEELQTLVAGLESSADTVNRNGLTVEAEIAGDIMTDSSNLRITMDSGVTNYTTQVLTGTVAHFVPITLDPSIVVTATGELDEIGECENTYDIEWGTADPDNYEVSEDLGTLTIVPLDLQINCGGGVTTTYDGKVFLPWPSLLYLNGSHAGERVYSTRLTGSVPGAFVSDLRLRAASHSYHFVLFTGDAIDLVISGFGTAPGTYTLTGSVSSASEILDHVSLSFSGSSVVIEPAELTVTTGSAEKWENGEPLTCEDVTVSGLADGDEITVKATGKQAKAGSSKNTYEIDWGSVDPECYVITEKLGTLTVLKSLALEISTETKEKVYDGEPLSVSDRDVTVTGLEDGDEIEVSVSGGEITDAGSVTPSFRINWGSVDPDKYAVKEKPGTLTVTPLPVTVLMETDSPEYDGYAHSPVYIYAVYGDGAAAEAANSFEWNPSESPSSVTADISLPGGTLQVSCGGYTDAGTYSFSPSYSFTSGKAGNYTVSVSPASMTISPLSVTLTSASASKLYDGSALTADSVDMDGYFAEGEDVECTFTGSQTDAGSSSNTFTYTLTGGAKASNYIISTAEGTLTVSKRNVSLTSGDASKTYDGTALTKDSVTVGGDGFASGEGATYNVTGTQKDAGSSANAFTYTLSSGTKADNYIISPTEGTLTVSKRTVTLTSGDASKKYDGTALSGGTVTVGGDGFASGEGATCSSSSRTDAGMSTNTITYTLNSGTKESNYTITKTEGNLTVSKRNVTLTSGSASRTYNNTALTNNEVTVGGDGFAANEGATYNVTGTRTEYGSSTNTFTYTLNSNTKEGNYDISKTEGTLTVNRLGIYVKIYFDGQYSATKYRGYEVQSCGDSSYTITVTTSPSLVLNITWPWGGTVREEFNYSTQESTTTCGPGDDMNYLPIFFYDTTP